MLPTGVLTLVFTDVEGSTRLLRELGPRYGALLAAHNEIVRGELEAAGGTVVRSEGDSFFCAFTDPDGALRACLNVQLRLASHGWPDGAEFKVRIGLHTGTVQAGGEDYVGLAVHQAARVSDAAHGGQTLLSQATRRLLGEELPAQVSLERLGAYRLKDFREPTELFQVCHPELERSFPTLRALPAAAHNLPEPATLFIGRRTSLRELSELVALHRLVTVLGAGGVGKTRLATEVAPLVVSQFPDGVWMIELANLRSGQDIAGEILAALGVRPETGLPIERMLAAALEGKHLLLLLDNCEHLLDELAPIVDFLIGACGGLHVLATSREPMALPSERRYPLAPLSLPEAVDGGEAAGSEAVELFVDRARIVAPGFDLARERAAVIEICRRLDGLPLAIELAAARAAAIPPARMAERLDRRFSVLRHGYRGRLAHHETLRASIEWSHELLEPEERTLFARLSAFAGEFDLSAAECVCCQEPLAEADVLDLLARLIEKSLLQPAGERYVMLESIREFAREQLMVTGETDELVEAHIDYYADLVEEAAAQASGPQQREAYDRIEAELPNIRLAVAHALGRSDPSALRLSAALGQYGFVRNRLLEVAHWCVDAAAIPDAPPGMRAQALQQAGFALVVSGSPSAGHALLDDALELGRQAGDRRVLAEALLMAADLRLEAGWAAEARPLAAEALAVSEAIGDRGLIGRALVFSARCDQGRLAPAEIAGRLGEALAIFEEAGDRRQCGRVLMTRAFVWLEAGDLEATEADAARCAALGEELRHPIGLAVAWTIQAIVAVDRDQLERARELLDAALITARDCGYQALLAYCVAVEAMLAAAHGDDRRAARLVGALDAADGVLGGERAIRLRVEALRGRLGGRLGTELAELLAEGERLRLEDLAAL
ncbi:MAG TPA: adenylate/guanylate cyclase domain-containing protein [Solirubrobacterales bacterium]